MKLRGLIDVVTAQNYEGIEIYDIELLNVRLHKRPERRIQLW